jgi:hypothetical protein
MIKRVLFVLIAVAIAGAPVALAVCEVTCASMSAHRMHADLMLTQHGAAHHAGCHDAARSPQQLSPHTRACDHDGETIPASLAAARNSIMVVPLAIAPSTTDVVAPGRLLTSLQLHEPSSPDRINIRLARSLRI